MFCTQCGKQIAGDSVFCELCGARAEQANPLAEKDGSSEEKWWYRLLKVFYVIAYIPLPFVLWLVWTGNSSSYDYYTRVTTDTPVDAIWYSLLTLVIYLFIFRLIKLAVLYVAVGQRPHWNHEFKKLF